MAKLTKFARGQSGKKSVRQLNTILTDYKRFVNVVDAEAFRIMEQAAKMVLDATIPHTPLQFGSLRESGRAFAMHTGRGVVAVVSFGGPDNPVTPSPNAPTGVVDYALKVHEDLERTYAVGGPKYLEIGALEVKQEVDDFIVNELKKLGL